MKNLKKVLALVLAVVMVMGAVVTTSAAYSDVKDTDTYADAITVASLVGILDGFPDETFKPEATLTRAQAAKIYAVLANAVTTGTIADDIDELYANALNPFVDCNGSWALPYINYCRITGLCDGMTATTYEPNREVTGVQFLKFMLTTLGYDTAKEGYTGTGWDINVLNRANELGLTDGLAEGWKAISPITRGEAAQIIVNGLQASLIEYGQKVTNTYVNSVASTGTTAAKDGYYASSFISNEVVKPTDKTLGYAVGKWTAALGGDEFMRPIIVWSKNGVVRATFDIAPVKSYTAQVDLCTILADLGVAKTNTTSKKAIENYYVNGIAMTSPVGANEKLAHSGSTCTLTSKKVGAQGTLTEVYYMAATDSYRIVEIETYLAQVEAVSAKTLRRDEHNNPTANTLKLHAFNESGVNEHPVVSQNQTITVEDASKYAKGDYVLVTYSKKKNASDKEIGIVDITVVEPVAGKLTGLYSTETKVDDTWKYDAAKFYLGKTDKNYNCEVLTGHSQLKLSSNLGKTFGFIYDAYGNVIGIVDNYTEVNIGVIDWFYLTAENGIAKLYADIVDLDAKTTEKVAVASINGYDANDLAQSTSFTVDSSEQHAYEYGINNSVHYDKLVAYTTNANGEYVLNKLDVTPVSTVTVKEGSAYLSTSNYAYNVIDDATAFLIHHMDGSYEAATGANVGTVYASNAQLLDLDNDGVLDIVYLYGAGEEGYVAKEDAKSVGFIALAKEDGVVKVEYFETVDATYAPITIYFDGEAKTVYVEANSIDVYSDAGFYTVKFVKYLDGKNFAKLEDYNGTDYTTSVWYVASFANNTLKVKNNTTNNWWEAYKVAADAVVYDVYNGTVTKAESADWVVANQRVMLGFNKAGVVNAIYVLGDLDPAVIAD